MGRDFRNGSSAQLSEPSQSLALGHVGFARIPPLDSIARRAIIPGMIIAPHGDVVSPGDSEVVMGPSLPIGRIERIGNGVLHLQTDQPSPSIVDITINQAFERVVGSVSVMENQLKLNANEVLTQAKFWSRASIISAVIGFLLIILGVILLLSGETGIGWLTTIGGMVPEVIAALFFTQSNRANRYLQETQQRLVEVVMFQERVNQIERISDRAQLERAKADALIGVLRTQD